jgi:DNA-binding response OmpR family regulator
MLKEVSSNPFAAGQGPRASTLPFRFADLEVDPALREVRRAGRLIQLRPKEFDLLLALMRRAGEIVTRRQLLQEVWSYKDDVVSRTIDTHLAELRRKLGHDPESPGYIVTVAKAGYRLQR